ncbi:hydroxyneurosporene-O-methyltransferase [Bradyrhizobium oligotrophicum S58]|uniref:Hydroxyneurosporene-O-methyltransferase n=1 Tax=Bradyrhizobium oligotrophicum S58 TaxID=1245469 RepID=M4ZDK5_9BRAD|nr:methyltransferase [Bradyrhizobium oligotrophicum]BAM91897.1 hydroxyneurosporene-O-methyltransferase [Bradyrhizobium oligotrophicum S58]
MRAAVRPATPSATSLSDRWRGCRDRLLASAAFQRWAAAFPLTRPIARKRAAELFDLCAGFVYSQTLAACVQLDLFETLRAGPSDVATLASRAAMSADAMTSLCEAASALQLLERRGAARYGLGPLGAALLGNPGIAAMIRHHAALYADLGDPVALLRGQDRERRLAHYWPYALDHSGATLTRDSVASYTALMAASQPMIADVVLAAYPLSGHRCLLDVGGGDGSFLAAAARQAPRLALKLFDLPEVAAIAQERLAKARLADRVTITPGSFYSDPLPIGADVISLIRVVHDHDDDAVAQLLAKARAALPDNGVLLLGEPMSEAASGADGVSAYFEIYLRAMGQGRPRSAARLRELLMAAGFSQVRQLRTRIPMIAGVIVAKS